MTTTRLVKSRPPAAAIIVISFRGQLLAYLRYGHVSRTCVCNPQTNFVISSRARASYGPSRPLYEMQSMFPSASCGTGSHDTRQFMRGNRTNWLARILDDKSPYFILFYPFSFRENLWIVCSHFRLSPHLLVCFANSKSACTLSIQ